MKKLIMMGAFAALTLTMAGCQSTEKEKENKEVKYEYVLDYSAQNNSCFQNRIEGAYIIDGKKSYIFPNDYSKDVDSSIYEFDNEKDEFIFSRDILENKDFREYKLNNTINDKENERLILYTEKDSEEYLLVYDIYTGETKSVCNISKSGFTEEKKETYAANKNTIIIRGEKQALICSVDKCEAKFINLSDYLDPEGEFRYAIIEKIDVTGDNVDLYLTNGREFSLYRVDVSKKEVVFTKSIEYDVSHSMLCYDDYIYVNEDGKYYIIDKETLENKIELKGFQGEYITLVDIIFHGDFLYIFSVDDGIYKMNLNDMSMEQIEFTKGMKINGFDWVNDNIYFISDHKIYKIDTNTGVNEKIADIDKKITWCYHLRMFTDDIGYFEEDFTFDSSCTGYQRYVWIEKKNTAVETKSKKKKLKITEESLKRRIYPDSDNYLKADYIDGKPVYLFYSCPETFKRVTDDVEEYPFGMAYYQYNKKEKNYTVYKSVVKDELEKCADFEMKKLEFDNDRDVVAVYANANAKDYIIVYDLKKNTSNHVCISDNTEEIKDINYIWKIQIVDDNGVALMFKDDILIYNVKDNTTEHIKISDYTDSVKNNVYNEDEYMQIASPYHFEITGNICDIYYYNSCNGYFNIVRINISQKKLLLDKKVYNNIINFFDDYIEIKDENVHYLNDKQTFDKKIDLKALDNNSEDKLYAFYDAKLYIKGDTVYSFTEDGIKTLDIKKNKIKTIKCTDGMCIRNFCMLDDIAYVINNDAIYKIDIKNNKKEKFADLEDKYNDGYGEIQMFSEKVGYCKGCYYTESEGYVDENELNVWFEQ